MAELTRITISLETSLLDAFDKHIAGKAYENRSEAIRDLIRDRLIREEAKHRDGEQVAVVTMVYDHHARELASKLIDKQHHHRMTWSYPACMSTWEHGIAWKCRSCEVRGERSPTWPMSCWRPGASSTEKSPTRAMRRA